MVMKNILTIVHQCYDNGYLDSCEWEQLFMNYLMYCAASEEKFIIPRIRKMFSKGMEDCMDNPSVDCSPHLDIAVKLNLSCAKYLATFSSFFDRLFFSGFKEADSESVKVSCSYDTVKLILEIIYGQSRDFSKIEQVYEIDTLSELYKAADFFDMPLIRNLCLRQMLDRPNVEMVTAVLRLAASGLDLHDTLIEIMKKMTPEDVKKFLSVEDSCLLFSKEDVFQLYKQITGNILLHQLFLKNHFSGNLLDLSLSYENPLIDSTKKWPQSDVLIKTRDFKGRGLYSNKTALTMVSPQFAEMISGNENSGELTEIEINVDYIVMKNILSVIHHCYESDTLDSSNVDHLVMNYLMFSAAAEDHLDIRVIRDLCVKDLLKVEKPTKDHCEVAFRMNSPKVKSAVIERAEEKELLGWMSSTCTFNTLPLWTLGDHSAIYYTRKDKPILSLTDVNGMIEKLLKNYK